MTTQQSTGWAARMSVEELLHAVASDNPTPGGGAVTALAAAAAAALCCMVAQFSRGFGPAGTVHELHDRASYLQQKALSLVEADRSAYEHYVQVRAAGKAGTFDATELTQALEDAARVPSDVAALAADLTYVAGRLAEVGNPRLRVDACVAAALGAAVAAGAARLVLENLAATTDDQRVRQAEQCQVSAAETCRVLFSTDVSSPPLGS